MTPRPASPAPRPPPRATYRFQFNRFFTLRQAAPLVPYLHDLGISHVYASPLLKAAAGSLHGYDVCDSAQLNPEIGSEADLEAFVTALHRHGMGLVLDIVPNHMAASPENPWWRDVLMHGPSSRYAHHFDIDWEAPDPGLKGKVLLPVLGDEFRRVLERGELKVGCENAEVTVRYFDHRFPVDPGSIPVPPQFLDETIRACNADWRRLEAFLAQQHYRLAFWKHGDAHLNYRRFFNITSLAGVRVELPQVFADTHNRILDWHQRGWLDGLRIDHPDGLRDPQGYLERLRHAAPGAWVVVEKILEPGEVLPPDWPVAGTTGYEFLNWLGGLFVDARSEKTLTEFYAGFTGETSDYAAMVRTKKRWALEHLLRPEIDRLVRLLCGVAATEPRLGRYSEAQFREALIELAAGFPVYRTYLRAGRPEADDCPGEAATELDCTRHPVVSEADIHHLEAAVQLAQRQQPALADLIAFLGERLRTWTSEASAEMAMRFQQLTGPAMAKGVEDTSFYCFNRFVALNEVGGNPGQFGVDADTFHHYCRKAAQRWPQTMLASSTHDTKRSEDVRARLALLSELPNDWMAAVRRWSALNEKHRTPPPNDYPDRNAEYLYYQTLVGAWPLPADRALAYMEKASREAKQHTQWTEPNPVYDEALKRFVTATLHDPAFLSDVEHFVTPLIAAGRLNSLSQTLIKLTAPGVPDIYQGTELWDLSLVDPDNRRPVDFDARREAMSFLVRRLEAGPAPELAMELWERSDDGRVKLFVLLLALKYRREHPELFRHGAYTPLPVAGVDGGRCCAFSRALGSAASSEATESSLPKTSTGGRSRISPLARESLLSDLQRPMAEAPAAERVIVVVPRLKGAPASGSACRLGEAVWGDARLRLTRELVADYRNVFTGERVSPDDNGPEPGLRLSRVFASFPVALLEAVH